MAAEPKRPRVPTRQRVLMLLACLGLGVAVGALGTWLGGNSAWFLAVPAAVAAGWLFVADPTACTPPSDSARR